MFSLNPRVAQLLRNVLAKENMQDSKVTHNYSGCKADGHTSSIEALKLVKKNKTLDIVIKYANSSDEESPIHTIFLNEIFFYEEILPAFVQLEKEYNIAHPFNGVATFYGAIKERNNECLILENIKSRNFEMWDRTQPMDSKHMEMSLKLIAKFHGTSYAFKAIKPFELRKLVNQILVEESITKFLTKHKFKEQLQKQVRDSIDFFDETTEQQYRQKMIDFAVVVGDQYESLLRCIPEGAIITHGDCWSNNFMFQYNDLSDRSMPVNIKLIDFQLVRQGLPVMDLSTLFYTTASQEMLNNEHYYFKMYYHALTQHLQQFNLVIDSIYTFQQFTLDWKKYCKLGLILTFVLKKIMFTKPEDAGDFSDPEFASNVILTDTCRQLYVQHMRQLIQHFVDNKYI